MALLIQTNATDFKEVKPADGKRFSLPEMQGFVGGFIEALQLSNGNVMYLNEDGKRLGLPFNPIADRIAHHLTGIADGDYIVGDVVIATRAETGDDGSEEEEEENE